MLLSFGGSLMTPVLDHYTNLGRHGDKTQATTTNRNDVDSPNQDKVQQQLDLLSSSIRRKVRNEKRMILPFRTIVAGLCIKTLLLSAVLAAMYIVSTGSVFVSYCMIDWWFLVWYIIVTGVTIFDAWAQLPFDSYVKLYLTDIRINYSVDQGELITSDVNTNLRQLSTLPAADLHIEGTMEPTKSRNTLLVIVSIVRDINDPNGRSTSALRYSLQILARLCSSTVYVFGTVLFSSSTLLAFPMAEMVLMLVLGAGVLSRVMATSIVNAILLQDSMIHIIANNEVEADDVVAAVFRHQLDVGETKFHVEVDGHIFLEGKRVTRRSSLYRSILGVLATPFDICQYGAKKQGQLTV
ncbi:hypothetical protein N0V90_009771 [Kalmusia sp. IMI 367209]|nr:hypothetical protein N0V90_009771 [Kalmusia sp. IMI 367209]